jgi:hypothetical protein
MANNFRFGELNQNQTNAPRQVRAVWRGARAALRSMLSWIRTHLQGLGSKWDYIIQLSENRVDRVVCAEGFAPTKLKQLAQELVNFSHVALEIRIAELLYYVTR